MGNRTAKFISAVIASIIAGSLSAESQGVPGGASDCLASPKGVAPQGQHWFYRLERDSKRKCWYLRGADAKAAPSAQTATASPTADAPTPHSVQDARAEFVQPQQTAPVRNVTVANAAPSAVVTPTAAAPQLQAAADDNGDQATVETRWPDPSSTVAPAAKPAPTPQPKFADARPALKPTPMATANSGAMTLASADTSADKPTGSVSTLLLAIGGALALAGLLASVIYRVAGSRLRVAANDRPRRVNWGKFEAQADDAPADVSRAPWVAETARSFTPRPQPARPIDFDVALAAAAATRVEKPAVARDMRPAPLAADAHDVEETHDGEAHDYDDLELLLPEDAEIALQVEAVEAALAMNDARMDDSDTKAADSEAKADDDLDVDVVDVDAITAILERLAKDGPRLVEPSPEADLAEFVQSRLARPAARA